MSPQKLLIGFVTLAIAIVPSFDWLSADERTDRIDRVFSDFDRPETPGCAVAVIHRGKMIHRRGYGQANLEWESPITSQTRFPVASLSKQFTALAVALLAEQGKLSLDDDIRKHLPELPDSGSVITLRHLLHHTSGLRDVWTLKSWAGWRPDDLVTNDDILHLASRQRGVNSRPGERFVYNNTGYTLLPLIVEKVSGQSLREFTQEQIFAPLGLMQTHFRDHHREVVPKLASAYSRQSGNFQTAVPTFSVVGSTGLVTTLDDLVLWDRNFYDRQVGGTSALDQMLTPGKLNDGTDVQYGIGLGYGMGLVIGEYRGLKTVSHSGLDWGYCAEYLQFPDQRCTVIVLGNSDRVHPYLLAREVADCVLTSDFPDVKTLPGTPKTQKSVNLTSEELQEWAGQYCLRENGACWSFSVIDGKLCLGARALTPLAKNCFAIGGTPIELIFSAGDGSTPRKLRWIDVDVQEYEAVSELDLTETQLQEFVGAYQSEELRTTFTVKLRGESLFVQGWRDEYGSLNPIIPDGFSLNPRLMPSAFFRFARDAENRVIGFELNTSGVQNLRFERLGESAE